MDRYVRRLAATVDPAVDLDRAVRGYYKQLFMLNPGGIEVGSEPVEVVFSGGEKVDDAYFLKESQGFM